MNPAAGGVPARRIGIDVGGTKTNARGEMIQRVLDGVVADMDSVDIPSL